MAVTFSPRATVKPFGGRIFNILGVVATWNDARQTRNALNALTNRELDDIGLTRADIARVASV